MVVPHFGFVTLAFVLAPALVSAQDTQLLLPGTRVRVRVAAPGAAAVREEVGTLVRLGADSLVLRPARAEGASQRAYALPAVARIEVSGGRSSSTLVTFVGIALGAAGGAALGGRSAGAGGIGGIFLGGFTGAVVGGGVGALVSRRDRWVRIRLVSP